MPKSIRAANQKPIHFIFREHHPNARYAPLSLLRNTKTHVFEQAWGSSAPLTDLTELSFEGPPGNLYEKSTKQFLASALKRGVSLIPGEFAKNAQEKKRLENFDREHHEKGKRIATLLNSNAPAQALLDSVREFTGVLAREHRFRHSLIKRTLIEVPKPLTARLGFAHSTLSAELKAEGIETSRTMAPLLFCPMDIVIRKILSGLQPTE